MAALFFVPHSDRRFGAFLRDLGEDPSVYLAIYAGKERSCDWRSTAAGKGEKKKMDTNVLAEIERLRRASLAELLTRYRELFGEDSVSRHREHLFRKMAWRVQSLAEGDLSERARARAQELARDADIRVIAPKGFFGKEKSAGLTVPRIDRARNPDRRLPIAGTLIERRYRDRTHFVEVLADGFRYEGRRHRSLSSIAREITGTRWNGLAFFGFANRSEPKREKTSEKTNHAGA